MAEHADAIVEGKLHNSFGAWNSYFLDIEIHEWLKRPSDIIAKRIMIQVPNEDLVQFPGSFPGRGDRHLIVFLNLNETYPIGWGPADEYLFSFAGGVAGYFSVYDGIVEYAGVQPYKDWPVEKFKRAVQDTIPTPEPIDYGSLNLAELGRKSRVIVEVELVTSSEQNRWILEDKRVLQNARVVDWLKTPDDLMPEYIGLIQTPLENTLLARGSQRYILFLHGHTSGDGCEAFKLAHFFAITEGMGGIFEIQGDNIDYAGVAAYQSWSVVDFKERLRFILPPSPPATIERAYESIGRAVQRAVAITEAEIVEGPDRVVEGQQMPQDWVHFKLRVVQWIKRPDDAPGDILHVAMHEGDDCRLTLGTGRAIVFLNATDKFRPRPAPKGIDYLVSYDHVSGIRDNTVGYTGYRLYWGWQVDLFISDIHAAMGVPTPASRLP